MSRGGGRSSRAAIPRCSGSGGSSRPHRRPRTGAGPGSYRRGRPSRRSPPRRASRTGRATRVTSSWSATQRPPIRARSGPTRNRPGSSVGASRPSPAISWRIRCTALRGMPLARASSRTPHSSWRRTRRGPRPSGPSGLDGGAPVSGGASRSVVDPVGLRWHSERTSNSGLLSRLSGRSRRRRHVATQTTERPTWPSTSDRRAPPARPAGRPAIARRASRDRGPVARDPDDPRRQPRPAEPRRHQGRRPPGVERLGRLDPDRALLPLAAAPATGSPSSRTPRPAFHAIQYLLGNLDGSIPDRACASSAGSSPTRRGRRTPTRSTSRRARSAWAPSRRCSPRLADRYLRAPLRRDGRRAAGPPFVALVGDAELDEGNVWEAVARGRTRRPRQRHDDRRPQPPEPRPRRAGHPGPPARALFAAAGWHVIEAKYGRRLQARFARPGGEALRRRIDDMATRSTRS